MHVKSKCLTLGESSAKVNHNYYHFNSDTSISPYPLAQVKFQCSEAFLHQYQWSLLGLHLFWQNLF